MKIFINAKPYAQTAEVKALSETHYEVKIDAPAIKGKANRRLIEILSDYFKVPQSAIAILSGTTSRQKVVEILK